MLPTQLNTSSNRKKVIEALKHSDPLAAIENEIKLDDLNLLTANQERENKPKPKLDIEEVVISNTHFSYVAKQ